MVSEATKRRWNLWCCKYIWLNHHRYSCRSYVINSDNKHEWTFQLSLVGIVIHLADFTNCIRDHLFFSKLNTIDPVVVKFTWSWCLENELYCFEGSIPLTLLFHNKLIFKPWKGISKITKETTSSSSNLATWATYIYVDHLINPLCWSKV